MEYQKQDDKIHRCLECGDKIRYGRTDKKFCCQACRAKHHNTILKEGRLYRRKVLSTLTKNYQLLESLIESGIDSIELTDIMSMGFSPHMVQPSRTGSLQSLRSLPQFRAERQG